MFNLGLREKISSDYENRWVLAEFDSRKNNIEVLGKSLESCKERIANFSTTYNELKDKITPLKKEIEYLKTEKNKLDISRPSSRSVIRIIKIAAILFGYTILGLISIGIIPVAIERSKNVFKKVYYEKLGCQILKRKNEISEIKDKISDLENQKSKDEDFVSSSENYLKQEQERHERDTQKVKGIIEKLESEQKTFHSIQTFFKSKIDEEPNNLIYHKMMETNSKKFSENVEKLVSLKNNYKL